MASILSKRLSLASMLGQLFGGKRKLYDVFGYSKNVTYKEAIARYRRQDIAARIVEAPANALWSTPPHISANNDEWNRIWREIEIKHKLWKTIARTDKLSGMAEFAVLVLGFDQSGKLNKPAGHVDGRQLIYLQPYAGDAADVQTLVSDQKDPRFMLPDLYNIKPGMDSTASHGVGTPVSFQVHHSRVLHLAENHLADEVFGNPRIERVWNLLDDLLKVSGGTSETFWLAANRGLQVDVNKDMELTDDDASDLSDEIEEYQHQLRRFIRTRGVDVKVLGSDIPNPKEVFGMLMSMISGATGIPKRILLGSEAGQLASEQDRNNWAERIEERRAEFGEPEVIWPLIRQLTLAGVLPSNDGLEISIAWPDAFRLTPHERAQTSAQKARSAINLAKTLNERDSLLTDDEAREILELDMRPEPVASDTLEDSDN